MSNKKRKDAEYIGYTYRGDDCVQTDLIKAIEIIENVKSNSLSLNANTPSIKDESDIIRLVNKKRDSNEDDSKFDISKDNISKNDIVSFRNIDSSNVIKKNNEINGLPCLKESNKEELNKTKLQIITLPKQLKLEKTELNKTPPVTSRNSTNKIEKKISNGNYDEKEITKNQQGSKNIIMNGLMSMKKSLSFKLKRNKSKSPDKDEKKKK